MSELEKKVTVEERKIELEELFKGEKQRIEAGTKWKTCRDKATGQTWNYRVESKEAKTR